MSRFVIMCFLSVALLVGCGGAITIALPGGTGAGGYPADGALPRGYERFLSPASYNFRFSWPGEPTRRGLVSERFELRDGDCADTDCPAGRLRAEIKETDKSPTARINQDIWYGWSFYNENIGAVTHDTSIGLVIGQWKQGGEQPPPLRLVQAYQGELNFAACNPAVCNPQSTNSEDVVAELEDMHVAGSWGALQNFGDVCSLFNMAANRGKWVDIVVNTNFASDDNGYLRIWINGVMKCNYFGRIVAPDNVSVFGAALNHRHGLFASYTKPFREKQGGAQIPTMIAYYDEFHAGKARGDVDPAYREQAGLRPKD